MKRGTWLGEVALDDREKMGMIVDPSIFPNIDLLSIIDRLLNKISTKVLGFMDISLSSRVRRRAFSSRITLLKKKSSL